MQLSIPGRAVVATVLALCAMPAAAQAGVIDEAADGTLTYRAPSGETNAVLVTEQNLGVELNDQAGVTSGTGLCAEITATKVRCALGLRLSEVTLGDRNDSASIRTTRPALIDGGRGDDLFFAGMSPAASAVEYRGGHETDTVSYASASAGALMLQDELAGDGRPSFGDRDNVRRDIENFIGSPFGDRLEGSRTGLVHCLSGCPGNTGPQRFTGGLGADTLRGGTNMDQHFMGGGADGADTILAGPNFTIVDYGGRALPVEVTVGHGIRDDGAAGEGDDIRAGVDHLIGGRGGDTLTQNPESDAFISLVGGPGIDELTGGKGGDNLDGGPGGDTLVSREGNDLIFARDGELDLVGCGSGLDDTAELDQGIDVSGNCENKPVGTLRLPSKAVRANAGEVAELDVRWRHPESWRKLAKVELRLLDGDVPVGEVVLRPAGRKMAADGAVTLVRKASRMTPTGKAVAAHLAMKLDGSLAGRTLRLDVEATGRDGSRQLERAAGTVRVAR